MVSKKPEPPKIHITDLQVRRLKDSSGLFFEGPTSAHNWQSEIKVNSGLIQKGSGILENVRSIVKDVDTVDTSND